jgi:transcriptional regulator with XRE-family HTH domain
MSNIGERITTLRKKKGLSQVDLAKAIEASRTMVGNYERNANAPSIEVIAKIAKVLDVSVDYLIGDGKMAAYDKEVIKRIDAIQALDEETQSKLFFLIDNVVQNFKAKQAFA